ncbi:type II toxin-antitoxin system PemK/MazF family toxin [Spirochaeta dissipatitropha]
MEEFVRGCIVVIPFPFSDLSSSKRRPALVIAELPYNDLLLCQITSKFKLDEFALPLSSKDFATGSLPSQSYVRCGKLFCASSSIVEKNVAQITASALSSIIETTIKLLRA